MCLINWRSFRRLTLSPYKESNAIFVWEGVHLRNDHRQLIRRTFNKDLCKNLSVLTNSLSCKSNLLGELVLLSLPHRQYKVYDKKISPIISAAVIQVSRYI